jgi:hypothetical protein
MAIANSNENGGVPTKDAEDSIRRSYDELEPFWQKFARLTTFICVCLMSLVNIPNKPLLSDLWTIVAAIAMPLVLIVLPSIFFYEVV